MWHDKHNEKKGFKPGQQVLFFNSRLKLFPRKLKSRWSGPFVITQVFLYGSVELSHPKRGQFQSQWAKIEALFWRSIRREKIVNKFEVFISIAVEQ